MTRHHFYLIINRAKINIFVHKLRLCRRTATFPLFHVLVSLASPVEGNSTKHANFELHTIRKKWCEDRTRSLPPPLPALRIYSISSITKPVHSHFTFSDFLLSFVFNISIEWFEKGTRMSKKLPITTAKAHEPSRKEKKLQTFLSFHFTYFSSFFSWIYAPLFRPFIHSFYFHPFSLSIWSFCFAILISVCSQTTRNSFQFPYTMLTNLFIYIVLYTWTSRGCRGARARESEICSEHNEKLTFGNVRESTEYTCTAKTSRNSEGK